MGGPDNELWTRLVAAKAEIDDAMIAIDQEQALRRERQAAADRELAAGADYGHPDAISGGELRDEPRDEPPQRTYTEVTDQPCRGWTFPSAMDELEDSHGGADGCF